MEHSLTNIMKEFLLENQTVLILILMEHSLTRFSFIRVSGFES